MDGVRYPGGVRPDGMPAVLSDPDRLAALRAAGLVGSGPEPVFDDLTRLAAAVTGCSLAAITFVDEYRTFWKSVPSLEYGGAAAWQNAVPDSFCYFPVGMGAPFIVEDAAVDPRTEGHPAIEPWGVGAWAGFPILGPGGEAIGSMCVIDPSPRVWRPQDLETMAALSRAVSNEINLRISLAATRAALEASSDLARSLQDSLLPPSLQPVPDLDTAALYLSATGSPGLVVGDFYDLFHARGPWWSAVMGDVCGKGVEAAKVTALARYTLRADASEHLSPATVLDRLNSAMRSQGATRFLTAAYTTFRTSPSGVTGRLCLAGHPPPLVRRADGRVDQLGTFGTLLGVVDKVRLTDVRFRLAAGDLLLLYTDGACEARPRPGADGGPARPMFGEEELARTLADCHGLDAAATIDHIAAALAARHDGWASDDTALLALRVPGGQSRLKP